MALNYFADPMALNYFAYYYPAYKLITDLDILGPVLRPGRTMHSSEAVKDQLELLKTICRSKLVVSYNSLALMVRFNLGKHPSSWLCASIEGL